MIKKAADKNGKVKVTFSLPTTDGLGIVAVAGDFNGWSEESHKLIKRNNGTSSVSIGFDPGQRYSFRYYSENGGWFNDEDADAYEINEHGSENCILLT